LADTSVRENLLLGAGADISVAERTLLALDANLKRGELAELRLAWL
jgi:hypothetical protein